MRTSSLLALITVASATVASQAHAHINATLGDTAGRNGDQKQFPCDGPKGAVLTYAPGATIEINVNEYVPHPGYFRVAFDPDGQGFVEPRSIDPIDPARKMYKNDFDQKSGSDFCNNDTVLWDNLSSHLAGESNAYKWKIKLPDIECDGCTLQVIQVMEDAELVPGVPVHGAYCPWDIAMCKNEPGAVQDIYHRCFDIKLQKGAKAGPGASSDDEVVITDPNKPKPVDCRTSGSTGDAGTPPVEPTADASTGSTGGSDAGVVTGSKQDASVKRDASASTSKDAGTAGSDEEPAAASKSDDGCALASTNQGAAWGLLALGYLLSRRRRRA